jgi:GTP cyclohydrolase II
VSSCLPPEPQTSCTLLRTKYGHFRLHVFSWSDNEQDNVLVLVPEKATAIPLVRIQSACYSGEIFESLDCDCHWQLETSLAAIQNEGGAFIYMLKDGRGAGLLAKIRGMALSQTLNIDTADAYQKMGIPLDPREYDQAAYVLRTLGFKAIRLLTNNPRKVDGMVRAGFEVTRVRLESIPTEYNREYLRSKAAKLGHLMKAFGTDSDF